MQKRVALITGGGSGIGYTIAQSLSRSDFTTILCGRNKERLRKASAQIAGSSWLEMDVSCERSVLSTFETLTSQKLLPDTLINNAGSAVTAPVARTNLTDWQSMLDINLTGAFLCTRAALPHMTKCGFGRIINIASTAGLKGYAYTAAYTAAKHGLIGLTRSLALELVNTGVTANAVCPGFTDTDIVQKSIDKIVDKTGRAPEDALAELTKHNPEGRLVTPKEVANTVSWLAGENASAINGQSIAVACGEVM